MNLSSITFENQENIGGGAYFLFVDAKGIDVFPRPFRENIEDDITLLSGFAWLKCEATEQTLGLVETPRIENGADGFDVVVNGVVPKQKLALQQLAALLDIKRVVAIYYDNNGEARVIGSKKNPANFKFTETNTGNKPGDLNSFLITVSITHGSRCPVYQGEAPEPGAVTCIGVNIVDQDENVIAYAPPGTDYPVIVFSGISDTGPPYTNSIVDNT